jgi:hypothetical protein
MSLSAPSPPDPYKVAAAQTQTNESTAKYQQEMNMVNQTNPWGSINYSQTGTNADGSPIFSANTTYNPAEQNLFNTAVSTQTGLGKAANNLINNLGPSLSQAPNLDPSRLTGQMMDWFNKYESPIWNQQQSNLDSKLAAQGITQGSDAWNNAQNLQARNVGDATNQYLMQAEPTAFNQAVTSYQLPIQTLGTLLGQSQPGSVTQNTAATPSTNISPANISGDIYQSYQGKLGNYQDTMNGIFGLGSAALGGWARMGMPSDSRIKENISQVGTLRNGLPIYVFNYKTDLDGIPQIGLMAQDVEKLHPDAVYEINGIKHVNYAKAVI